MAAMGGMKVSPAGTKKTKKTKTYRGGSWNVTEAVVKASLVWGVIIAALCYRKTVVDFVGPRLYADDHWCWTPILFILCMGMTGNSPFVAVVIYGLLFHKDYFFQFMGPDIKSFSLFYAPTIAVVTYWGNGLILFVLDAIWRPEVYTQFKIQSEKRFDMKKIWKVAKNIILGQAISFYGMGIVYLWIKDKTGLGCVHPGVPPSDKEILITFLLSILVDEVLFFYCHWAFHTKLLFPFHKIHHEFKSPIGLVAMYSHPLENLLCNVLPFSAGPMLLCSNCYSLALFEIMAVFGTQMHHSGIKFPWMMLDHQPQYHDYHHEQFNYNFGNIGWLDKLHGTEGVPGRGWKKREEHYRQIGKILAPLTAKKSDVALPAAG